jgi:dethiobiotin synthetase
VGGWLVPINATQTMADVALVMALPVVLVVGVRLGCINHALLTAAAIERTGAAFAGWVANRLDPDCEAAEETVAALRERVEAPFLGELRYAQDEELMAEQLRHIRL